jgi:choline dehydrogenase-like flavoprotein
MPLHDEHAMTERFDIIIIGTGAGGGSLLHRLAPSGKRILVLERGDFVPREPDNWSSRAAVREEKYHAKETWFDMRGRPFRPGTHYNVGGNTKFYGAALFRLRREDFQELRHHGGVSPAWPVGYDEFERYYTEAERLYEVRGERGVDPTEPLASEPYPHPAIAHEPRIQDLSDHFSARGCRPFKVPLGVRRNERADRKRADQGPCVRCATCDGYPCLAHAKSDAEVTCVLPATRYPNVTLLTGARAVRLKTAAGGRSVRSIVVEHDGTLDEYEADIVVCACGAVNSAALLLRSANEHHPRGLANSSDLVGRNYMAHNNSVLFCFSLVRNPTLFQKTLAVNDFYFSAPDWDFPLGHISMVGKFDGQMFKAGAPPLVPTFLLSEMGKRSVDFWLTSEDLPDPENRVTVNANGHLSLRYVENNLEAHRRLVATLKRLLRGWDGGLYLTKGAKIPLAGVAHQCGTLRFGTDPATSVLDVDCRAHDVDNLYVVDASFFPSSGAVNPALTIIANALRVGDRLLDRMGVARESRHDRNTIRRLPVVV